MESYSEPSWRGVLGTLVVTVLVIVGLVLLASFLLQEACVPGSGVNACETQTPPPPGDL